LKPSFPDLSSHPLSDYKVITSEPALLDMAKIIGTTSRVEAPFALVPTYHPQATVFSVEIPTDMGPRLLLFSQTNDKKSPTALIFYDSFSIALRPFLAEHFSRAVYVDYLAAGDIPYLTWYKQFQPDIVIFEITERALGNIPSLFEK